MLSKWVMGLLGTAIAIGGLAACESPDESDNDNLIEPQGSASQGLQKDRGGSNGDFDYCSGTIPCDPGEGDCDSDAQCTGGSVCGTDNGPLFNFPTGWDVCVAPHCTDRTRNADELFIDCGGADCGTCVLVPFPLSTCDGTNGEYNFCSTACPCGQVGQGDCDDDSECGGNGLVCKHQTGAAFGMPANWDNCVEAHCRNGTQDSTEIGKDCGGPGCDPCITPAGCGNGVRQPGEACDDGNRTTETTCPAGQTSCQICNSTCTQVLTI